MMRKPKKTNDHESANSNKESRDFKATGGLEGGLREVPTQCQHHVCLSSAGWAGEPQGGGKARRWHCRKLSLAFLSHD